MKTSKACTCYYKNTVLAVELATGEKQLKVFGTFGTLPEGTTIHRHEAPNDSYFLSTWSMLANRGFRDEPATEDVIDCVAVVPQGCLF